MELDPLSGLPKTEPVKETPLAVGAIPVESQTQELDNNLFTVGGQELPETQVLGVGASEPAKEPTIITPDLAQKETVKNATDLTGMLDSITQQMATMQERIKTEGITPETPKTVNTVRMYKNGEMKTINGSEYDKYVEKGWDTTPTEEYLGGEGGTGTTTTPVKTESQKLQEYWQTKLDEDNAAIAKLDQQLEMSRFYNNEANQGLITSIQQTYSSLRAKQEEINKAATAAIQSFGIRYGTDRYSPLVQTGIVTAQANAGISALAALDAKEAELIAAARKAQTDQDYKALNDKMTEIKKGRDKKEDILLGLQTEALKKSEELDEKKIDATQKSTIIGLVDQGITNPYDILDLAPDLDPDIVTSTLKDITEIQSKQFAETAKRAETYAPLLIDMFGEDGTVNDATIQELSSATGIPYEQLYKEAKTYITSEQERITKSKQSDLNLLKTQSGLDLDEVQIGKAYEELIKLQRENEDAISGSSAGLRTKILSLPTGQQEPAFSAIGVFKNAKDLLDLLNIEKVSTGPSAGVLQKTGQLVGATSDKFNRFLAGVTLFTSNYLKATSGLTVSDNERKMLMQALPSATKQEEINIAGINTVVDFLRNKFEFQIGVNFDDYPDDIPQDIFEGSASSLEQDYESFIQE